MAYIGKTPTVGNFQVCDAISVVNGQAAYTLQVGGTNVAPESANHMLVSLNGILQKPGSSFTISSSTMTFASNLATGDVIDFVQILGNVLDIGQPSDDTVTAAKLNNDIISGTTALTAEPADTDEFLVSDAGTLKRIDYSLIKGSGKLLQVVTNEHATRFVTSSTSYVAATGYTVVITPSATSSKIFLINSGGGGDTEAADRILYGTYYRTISGGSATDIVSDAEGISQIYDDTDRVQAPLNMSFLDSPNTTSAITYQIYIKSNSGQVSYNNNEGKAQFTAFEIAG